MTDEERRVHDKEWKEGVDHKLSEGVAKFDELAKGQMELAVKLQENTDQTVRIGKKLDAHADTVNVIEAKIDDHIVAYGKFAADFQPALDAIMTMQAGVRAIGVITKGFIWIGKIIRKTIIWVAPVIGAIAAIWHYLVNGFKP